MNIHEHQARPVAGLVLPVPAHTLATTPAEVAEAARRIGAQVVVSASAGRRPRQSRPGFALDARKRAPRRRTFSI
jgi:succinyl-CoA synthetase beta subunit